MAIAGRGASTMSVTDDRAGQQMSTTGPTLAQLARTYGIATEFSDWQGRHVPVEAETIVAVLRAMGVEAATVSAAQEALSLRLREPWRRMLPPCVVARTGQPRAFAVHVTHGDPVEVWIELEQGSVRTDLRQVENGTAPVDIDGRLVGEASFEVPADLAPGYHTLRARSGSAGAAAALIVTPAWLGVPARLGRQRAWGLATQLYSVRSHQSWGVGDLTDLTDLAVWSAAEHRAGFVLVNPLHAAEPTAPLAPSPYLPATRRFASPLYLRVERIPEFADLAGPDRTEIERRRRELHDQLDQLDRVDRDRAWTAKRAALEAVFAVARTPGRELAFGAYQRREGAGLEDFATWCALADRHGGDWSSWPEELRHPDAPGVSAFRAAHPREVDFHRWLQWVLDEQLGAAQAAATGAGMTLGIMHDLAVGVTAHGADTWRLPDVYAPGMTVGAPPDAFNQAGQDWTQPPWRPDRLAELAYRPFRDMVAAILRHAGGIRVDHILGLFRLWWIPAGSASRAGTYVRYDHEALVGILALEASRAGAVVVGEDLGTVEPGVRDYLSERGILGTSILWFENDYDHGGGPLPARAWREYCLASVTTHDLPPTAGYLAGDHVRLRHDLGLLTRSLAEELAVDEAERGAWLAAVGWGSAEVGDGAGGRDGDAGDDGDGGGGDDGDGGGGGGGDGDGGAGEPGDDVAATVLALYGYLTATPARLIGVALTDAVGDRRTQNQPGTLDEYPNWRVPLTGPDGQPVWLEDILASPRAAALAEAVDIGISRPRPGPD